jgi:hypothetical protein
LLRVAAFGLFFLFLNSPTVDNDDPINLPREVPSDLQAKANSIIVGSDPAVGESKWDTKASIFKPFKVNPWTTTSLSTHDDE